MVMGKLIVSLERRGKGYARWNIVPCAVYCYS
jgi:hypothetical protein